MVAAEIPSQFNVLLHREMFDEVVVLINEADVAGPVPRSVVFGHACDVVRAAGDDAGGGVDQSACQFQQG